MRIARGVGHDGQSDSHHAAFFNSLLPKYAVSGVCPTGLFRDTPERNLSVVRTYRWSSSESLLPRGRWLEPLYQNLWDLVEVSVESDDRQSVLGG